ncbi:DUF397 domain-containing protein [Thermobifida halotolerans]|uniref:DUF397 domain-containing protein n=1 Tax=Thermobifida halotolerans TaxID=483545 RepID=A0A399G0Z4_9ACTN|nr:DUF397 domain-containing protein [Thermobifida halotolerans]
MTAQHLNGHRSSYSDDTDGECVEAAETPGAVLVRESSGHLDFAPGAWSAFLADLKAERL